LVVTKEIKLNLIKLDKHQLSSIYCNKYTTILQPLYRSTSSIVRQMQKNFRVKGKKLCFGFVDLEKAFDKVPHK